MPDWLKNAIFYEIYPQSFCDANGDGIGDIEGIISKLDYIKETGFNAIWLNPCFDSPFKDAGYDVRDYYKVAPRYGTDKDLRRLFDKAHSMGIRVILDLVPGHTSDECEWFKQSGLPTRNKYSDRYIWTNSVWDRPEGYSWVAGNADRDGSYMLNFFVGQPALNYGFNKITDPSWQIPYTDPRAQATFDEMLNVMRFWLDAGCDGFRVDMTDSLVKNDDDKTATSSLWRRARKMLDESYPEAVLVSEWCDAPKAINQAGLHCDFILDHWYKLVHYATRQIERDGSNKSYFCKTSRVSAKNMLKTYLDELAQTQGNGYMSVISGNHDTPRVSYTLADREARLFYALLFTLPGVPFMYYGDEIGMRYIPQSSKEGGYQRTGSRTPMQWDSGLPNLGFSSAAREKLYLDVDRQNDAPTVSDQQANPDSLLNTVKTLVNLRLSTPELQADEELQIILCDDNGVLCYRRGDVYAAFNPTDREQKAEIVIGGRLFEIGKAECIGKTTVLAPQTVVIWRR